MNIVVYSYNFFPQADAESYCATRFASALARAGENVTVITMDWPMQVSQKSYDALVAKELNIVRVPFSKKINNPIKALLWYGHKSQMAVDVPKSVKIVKKILKTLDKPILVTRAHPVASHMVGLKTYKYAFKWVAHFSDPIPWVGGYSKTFGHRLLRQLEINIIKRSLLNSDIISLTCKHAAIFYKETYGKIFDESKMMINTHIGDYRLKDKYLNELNVPQQNSQVLLHSGTIYANRGGKLMIDLVKIFEQFSINCNIIQVGYVDSSIYKLLNQSKQIKIFDTISLEKSLELCQTASAFIVPDFETDSSYSPVLLSKFVYNVMENQPIIVYSKYNSEMHDYAIEYPEAGIFWAEEGNLISLKIAIENVLTCDRKKIDRTRIRSCFSETTISNNFVKAITCKINK